ncbi:MAG: hypothetical protein AAFV88_25940, partial [Planctomycetota bacterium]
TLRQCYESYLLPSLEGRRANKTTSAYRTALAHWERFVHQCTRGSAERGSTVSTPALQSVHLSQPVDLVSQITDAVLNRWGVWLMSESGPKLSVDTSKKQWRCVRAILRKVGPRESRNPRALGYLDRVPAMDPLDELAIDDERDGPQDVTDEQLDRIYEACDVATWPGEASPLQWRTYLVLLSVMGPRVNDGARLTPREFSFDTQSPVARSSRTYEHGWLTYRPTKTKRSKPMRLIVPMPPVVCAHVKALAGIRSGRLFGWSDANGHRFAAEWARIVETAGLDHIERRHMRATANLRWDRAGGDRQLGRWVLGHASRDVNDEHYMRAEPDLIEAAPRVEVPKSFTASPGDAPTQLFLFG